MFEIIKKLFSSSKQNAIPNAVFKIKHSFKKIKDDTYLFTTYYNTGKVIECMVYSVHGIVWYYESDCSMCPDSFNKLLERLFRMLKRKHVDCVEEDFS